VHLAGERDLERTPRFFPQARQHLMMAHGIHAHVAHAGDDVPAADLGRGRARLALRLLHDRLSGAPRHEHHAEAAWAAEDNLDEFVRHPNLHLNFMCPVDTHTDVTLLHYSTSVYRESGVWECGF
jgi:hypothetical protein